MKTIAININKPQNAVLVTTASTTINQKTGWPQIEKEREVYRLDYCISEAEKILAGEISNLNNAIFVKLLQEGLVQTRLQKSKDDAINALKQKVAYLTHQLGEVEEVLRRLS